jgi:N-acyl homoserine lactone hydrolase
MSHTLADELRALKLEPADIGLVALSHVHADHVGNVGLFPKATFLLSHAEWNWALGEPRPSGVTAEVVARLGRSRLDLVDGDRDLFGDGSVRILRTPGHTPGHQSLLVTLAHAGPVLISGDLFHRRDSLAKHLVPKGNSSRADTLASMDRIERLAKRIGARILIQHDAADIAAMPRVPRALD